MTLKVLLPKKLHFFDTEFDSGRSAVILFVRYLLQGFCGSEYTTIIGT